MTDTIALVLLIVVTALHMWRLYVLELRARCLNRLLDALANLAIDLEVSAANLYYVGATGNQLTGDSRNIHYRRAMLLAERAREIEYADIWEVRRIYKLTDAELLEMIEPPGVQT